MSRIATSRSRTPILRLIVFAFAAGLVLAACGGGGGGGGGGGEAKSTAGVTLDVLSSMLLTVEDLPGGLTGFTVSDKRAIPNNVKANTGGDDKPVTLNDPDYGDNLADMNRWGRQGGYRVEFTRDAAKGEINQIKVELNLNETEKGAHDFFLGWFASDPSGCIDLGDESDCSGFTLQNADTGENYVSRYGTFRTERIIGEVDVSVTLPAGQEESPELDDTIQQLARVLFDKIQAQL